MLFIITTFIIDELGKFQTVWNSVTLEKIKPLNESFYLYLFNNQEIIRLLALKIISIKQVERKYFIFTSAGLLEEFIH